jgi:hypothetical protein
MLKREGKFGTIQNVFALPISERKKVQVISHFGYWTPVNENT